MSGSFESQVKVWGKDDTVYSMKAYGGVDV
jgi:hypothetical protein